MSIDECLFNKLGNVIHSLICEIFVELSVILQKWIGKFDETKLELAWLCWGTIKAIFTIAIFLKNFSDLLVELVLLNHVGDIFNGIFIWSQVVHYFWNSFKVIWFRKLENTHPCWLRKDFYWISIYRYVLIFQNWDVSFV